jgi:hypothetical protein
MQVVDGLESAEIGFCRGRATFAADDIFGNVRTDPSSSFTVTPQSTRSPPVGALREIV